MKSAIVVAGTAPVVGEVGEPRFPVWRWVRIMLTSSSRSVFVVFVLNYERTAAAPVGYLGSKANKLGVVFGEKFFKGFYGYE